MWWMDGWMTEFNKWMNPWRAYRDVLSGGPSFAQWRTTTHTKEWWTHSFICLASTNSGGPSLSQCLARGPPFIKNPDTLAPTKRIFWSPWRVAHSGTVIARHQPMRRTARTTRHHPSHPRHPLFLLLRLKLSLSSALDLCRPLLGVQV